MWKSCSLPLLVILVILVGFCASDRPAGACTVIALADRDTVLVGNNEDWKDPDTWMWLEPRTEEEHGRLCVGVGHEHVQGGMNDQGLAMDGLALDRTGWTADPSKPDFTGRDLTDFILAELGTVDEVAAFFRSHNVSALAHAKFLVADASGASIVVEWRGDSLQILRRSGRYQIATNFVQPDCDPDDEACVRYRLAEHVLEGSDEVSVDLVRGALAATHKEFYYPTLYSNIYDLKNRTMLLYNFHDFERVVKINLATELARAPRRVRIDSLFPLTPYSRVQFERERTKSGARVLHELIIEKGLESALARYHELEGAVRVRPTVDVGERELNRLGYRLLAEGRIDDAVAIFELCAAEHPDSANAHDSLGEAYAARGDSERAAAAYRRSLELDPGNDNAARMLEELESAP